MGKLIVTEFVTLDGVAQAPGGPDEDRDGGFRHGGWQAPLLDQEAGGVLFEQARKMDALLLGRRTYEIFAGYWPTAPQEIPFTGLLNRVPKYVASRTLAGPLAWHGSALLAEPIDSDGEHQLREVPDAERSNKQGREMPFHLLAQARHVEGVAARQNETTASPRVVESQLLRHRTALRVAEHCRGIDPEMVEKSR